MAVVAVVKNMGWIGTQLKAAVIKVTPSSSWTDTGEALDLTGLFDHRCWAAGGAAFADGAKGTIRFSIETQGGEETAISSSNVKLMAFRTGTAADADLNVVASAQDISSYVTYWLVFGF